MAINYDNIFHSKAFQNIPKLIFYYSNIQSGNLVIHRDVKTLHLGGGFEPAIFYSKADATTTVLLRCHVCNFRIAYLSWQLRNYVNVCQGDKICANFRPLGEIERLSDLGEFSPIGRFFTLARFSNITTEAAQIFWTNIFHGKIY
jgi:hypothetical protein